MNLTSSFEPDLQEAVLDQAEHELIGKQDNLVHQFVQRAHDRLREYGDRYDYNVEPIIESFEIDEIDRSDSRLTIRLGWTHEASVFMELGTSDHTVEGDPVLSFVWSREDAPAWVAQEFEPEGDGYRVFLPETEPSGLPESRFVRDALNWLRREVSR
jgi:hypothetical protein